MKIGIDIDGVLTDIEQWQLDYGSKFYYENYGLEIKNYKGYETNEIFDVDIKLDDEYWKKNNKMIDYFLLHDFLSIVLEFYEEDWKKIIPVDNSTPHILLLRLFDKYDEDIWNSIKEQVPFHKLTYKFEKEKMKEERTFYKRLLK